LDQRKRRSAFFCSSSYSASNPTVLTAVADVANIPVGARVSGAGVGREVYVTAKNTGTQTLTLSHPLYAAAGTQTYTFTRYKYILDFSGFAQLDRMNLDELEIQCNGDASAVLLPPSGNTFHIRDCYVIKPKDRGVTSIGTGCQDLLMTAVSSYRTKYRCGRRIGPRSR
jgi:hypothetical protein